MTSGEYILGSIRRVLIAVFTFLLLVIGALTEPLHAQGTDRAGVWRIRVASGIPQDEANRRTQRLAGISDVEVLPYQGQFGVFVGRYPDEPTARKAADDLLDSDGVLSEGVDFIAAPGGGAPPPRAGTGTTGTTSPGATQGSAKFRALVLTTSDVNAAEAKRSQLEGQGILQVELLNRGNSILVVAGFDYASEAELQTYLRQLRDLGFEATPIDLNAPAAAPTPRPQPQNDYEKWVLDAIISEDFARATTLLNEWERQDPTNAALTRLRQQVQRRMPATTPAPVSNEAFDRIKAQAESAESGGNLDASIQTWQSAVQNASFTEEQRSYAFREIGRLTAARGGSKGGGLPYGLIGIVLGVIVVGAGVAFVIMKKKGSSAPAPSATGSSLAGAGAALGTGTATPAAAPKPAPAPKAAPAKAAASKQAPAASSSSLTGAIPGLEMNFPGAPPIGAAPTAPPPAAAPSPAITPGAKDPAPHAHEESETVNLADTVGLAHAADPEQPAPQAHAMDTEELQIDGAFGSSSSPAVAPPEVPTGGVPVSPTDSVPLVPAPAPVKAQPAAPPSTPAVARPTAPAAAGKNYVFRQDFDEEQLGSQPAKWEGQYDYATLTVVERQGDSGSGRCMRFEKPSGSGSAFFSCKFPNASGRVVIEFDLRCDNKNKYLLGFYIEQDADFRQSIHTVVHRDIANAEKVSLRLQNEPTPYELGEWVHVRFLVDLPRSLVDGYVNDKPVAVGVRLASRPKFINTLSIRDNLATEGILMIDNIEIYADR